MVAWMSREAVKRTVESREMHFFSRSRAELWHKGATSGNRQLLRELRYDCDGDTVLALVDPLGPACHTGSRTCFFGAVAADGERSDADAGERRPPGEPEVPAFAALPELARTLADRRRDMPDTSYTADLLRGGVDAIGAKVREEAAEVVDAARDESDERVASEAADLLYHLAVLLESRGLEFADAFEVLVGRMRR